MENQTNPIRAKQHWIVRWNNQPTWRIEVEHSDNSNVSFVALCETDSAGRQVRLMNGLRFKAKIQDVEWIKPII